MKRIVSILLVLCLILSFGPSVSADSQLQHNYSNKYNSGIRHETCTTLLGTSVDKYYTGSYTYSKLSAMEGDELLYALRDLMTDTHTSYSSYNDCHYKANQTDCENGDGKSISLIYTSYSATQSDWAGSTSTGWNREHVWPKSLGGFDTSYVGSDLHHIRPSDAVVNSTRNNKKYGNVTSGSTAKGSITGSLSGGTYNSTYFEPVDDVKGDVARIVLYVYVRWGGDSRFSCNSVTKVFQSVDVLLEWCALDPVDTWEMGRNEVVAAIQGNRNVFIDYPELAWLIFDKEIPENLTTPSIGSSAPSACTHSETVIRAQEDATCTSDGYTGDTWCSLCNKKLNTGTTIPALGHTWITVDQKDATCLENGYTGDVVCARCNTTQKTGEVIPAGHTETIINSKAPTCGDKGYTGDTYCSVCKKIVAEGKSINATGEHVYGDWEIGREPTANQPGYYIRYCQNCLTGYEKSLIPAGSNPQPPSSDDDRSNQSDGDRNQVQPDSGDNRNSEDEGDRNSAPTTSNPDDSRNNESEGDRNQVQPGSDPQEGTVETIQPEITEPTQITQPDESIPETTAPIPGETTVSTEPVTQTPTTAPSETTSPSESAAGIQTESPSEEDPDSSNGIWILVCIIVLAVCAAGIIVYFAANRAKSRKPQDDPKPSQPQEDPETRDDSEDLDILDDSLDS